jgi:hypothetical protein
VTIRQPVIETKVPYCGPTAIALLTGVPYSRVEHMIRRKRGGYRDRNGRRKKVKGSYHWEVTKILKRLGCKVEEIKVTGSTLGAFVEDQRHAGTMLVRVTGHFMVASGGMVADTTYPTPVAIEQYPKHTRRVVQAWRVVAPETPRYTVADPIDPVREPKPKPDIRLVRYQRAVDNLKRWQTKAKRAETAMRKLRKQVRYYETALAADRSVT